MGQAEDGDVDDDDVDDRGVDRGVDGIDGPW